MEQKKLNQPYASSYVRKTMENQQPLETWSDMESLRKVMLSIAIMGPQTKYDIQIKTPKVYPDLKVSKPSLFNAITLLEKRDWIAGKEKGKTRTGLPKI